MDINVVAISGKMGSGKSTISAMLRVLVKSHPKWQAIELVFAGAIYDMHNHCRSYIKKYGFGPKGVKDGGLLQYLGTEWGRKVYDENIWVKILEGKIFEEIEKASLAGIERLVIVVPDTRFKNELAMVAEWNNSIKVRLECPEVERKMRCSAWRNDSQHPSEVDLDGQWEKFDLVIDTMRTGAAESADLIYTKLLAMRDMKMV